jgi:hypothetical protein
MRGDLDVIALPEDSQRQAEEEDEVGVVEAHVGKHLKPLLTKEGEDFGAFL